ncbi:hypothetical protein HDU97_005566 [Phlyctochytrium planicorne]|nr:hypothetical protein HDU97_005566 [Phlyctochytrium planicorne]
MAHIKSELQEGRAFKTESQTLRKSQDEFSQNTQKLKEELTAKDTIIKNLEEKLLNLKAPLFNSKTRGIQTENDLNPKRNLGVQTETEVHTPSVNEREELKNEAIIFKMMQEREDLLRHQQSLEGTIEDWKRENESLQRVLAQKENLADDDTVSKLKEKIASLKRSLHEERLNLKKATFLLKRCSSPDATHTEHGIKKDSSTELQEFRYALSQSKSDFGEIVVILNENRKLKQEIKALELSLGDYKAELIEAIKQTDSLHTNVARLSTEIEELKRSKTLEIEELEKSKSILESDLVVAKAGFLAKEELLLKQLTDYEQQFRSSLTLYNEILCLMPRVTGCSSEAGLTNHPYKFEPLFVSSFNLLKATRDSLVQAQAKVSELSAAGEKISSRLINTETQLSESVVQIKTLESTVAEIKNAECHAKVLLAEEQKRSAELESRTKRLIQGCIAFATDEPVPELVLPPHIALSPPRWQPHNTFEKLKATTARQTAF